MKKLFILIPLLIFSRFIYAQETAVIEYLFTGSEGNSSINIIQYLNNGKSLELMVPKNETKNDSIFGYAKDLVGNENYKVFSKSSPRIPFIFKDEKVNQLLLVDGLGFTERVLTKDTLNNFKWKISVDEKIKIGKYNCTKAFTRFRGRNYIAWFTNDVNVISGPWKFGGLPGLIVEISDVDNMYKFELLNISSRKKIDINIPEIYKNETPISHKDYIIRRNIYKQNIEGNSNTILFNGIILNNVKNSLAQQMELY